MNLKLIKKLLKLALISYFAITLSVIAVNQFIYHTGYFEDVSLADNKAPIKFYVINLDRQPEKLAKLKAQTDKYGIELTRFSAIDGYKITLVDQDTKEVFLGSEIKNTDKLVAHHKYAVYCTAEAYEQNQEPEFVYEAFKDYYKALSPGELGVICSSRILWKQITANSSKEISVIFEDDALLFSDFGHNLQDLVDSLPTKWDMMYLDRKITYNPVRKKNPLSWSNIFRFNPITVNKNLIKIPAATDVWGAYGYVINNNSAQKLLDLQSRNNGIPLDNVFSDSVKHRKIIAYVAKDPIMTFDRNLESDIESMGR